MSLHPYEARQLAASINPTQQSNYFQTAALSPYEARREDDARQGKLIESLSAALLFTEEKASRPVPHPVSEHALIEFPAIDYCETRGGLLHEIQLRPARELIGVIGPVGGEMGPWLSGGFCTRLLDGRPTSDGDLDLFFNSVAQYSTVCDQLKQAGFVFTKDQLNSSVACRGSLEVNLVHMKYFQSQCDVFNFFDLTISQAGIKSHGDVIKLVTTTMVVIDIATKIVRINNVHHPITTLYRIMRYHKQSGGGYQIAPQEIAEFLNSVVADPASINAEFGYGVKPTDISKL